MELKADGEERPTEKVLAPLIWLNRHKTLEGLSSRTIGADLALPPHSHRAREEGSSPTLQGTRITPGAGTERREEDEVIKPSTCEWSSPIGLVPKPNGSIHFCNDFRALNSISRFDATPFQRIDELLGKARYISTLDLTKRYWQMPLVPEDRHETSFATPYGLFQCVRLLFGFHGAAANFQRLIRHAVTCSPGIRC